MQLDDLKTELQFLADAVVALQGQVLTLQKSASAEIARVEEVIAALKNQTGIDPKELEPLTAQLQTTVDNLRTQQAAIAAAQAELDGEQSTPPPAVAAGA